MSDSSKTIENEINDEPLDPRIQIELEHANAATSEINNLETQLDNARKLFQISFTHCKQRLANLAKKLGRCVERARPYYNTCKQAEEAQLETQKAAQDYQNSVELYYTAQEDVTLKDKVTQAEQDKIRSEQIHEEKSKLYQEYEQQRISLYRSLTKVIIKSKPYFDAKLKAENELKDKKLRIEDVQKAIIQAKKTYRTALSNLEQISEEIHTKRKLPPREPGVGSEKPDEFIELPNLELTEFPKLDLSDDSSDNDLSSPISSQSIPSMSTKQHSSTNCMSQSSNTISSLTNNHFSTQMIARVNTGNDQRRKKNLIYSKDGKIKSTRVIRANETPLLLHLFGTHKFHSDSNLNLMTKQ